MANATVKLEQIVMEAAANGDIAPVLATGGAELMPALPIANRVQREILQGGPVVQTMGWKWNRVYGTPFNTNSLQQDYAQNNLTIGWLERSQAIDVNNTSQPKPCFDVLARRDLVPTYRQFMGPVVICWLYNNQLMYGTWGAASQNQQFGLNNPGPGVVYTNPIGANLSPNNPITQIKDPNGNYWVLTTYGTCGNTQPSWTNPPTFPTIATPDAVASTVSDGTCVWSAINPLGQGFRLAPLPPQTGRVWEIYPIWQAKPVQYKSLEDFISPIPDELYTHFSTGFEAICYTKCVDAKMRAKGQDMYAKWIASLDNAVRSGNLEPDDFRFVAPCPIMAPTGDGYGGLRPDFPLSDNGLAGGWM
jgi:hypothetical protein